MGNDKITGDLSSLVEKSITEHPGYAEFADWCAGQLIHPSQIYFLVWEASRAALLKRQEQEQEEFLAHFADYEPEDTFHG